MTVWNEVIFALGGNAMLLAVLGFLARSLLRTWLAKDIKNFENELKRNADTELERLKSQLKSKGDASIEQLKSHLQIAAVEHQVQFSNLHEKRAQVVAEIYKRLVQSYLAGRSFVSPLEFAGEPSKQEKAKETGEKIRELSSLFEISRIYLPHSLCILLDAFLNDLQSPVIRFDMSLAPEDPAERKNKMTEWIAAYQAFEKEIPKARLALEIEFRNILGVK